MKFYVTASLIPLSLLISSFGCGEEATTPNCGCDGETVREFESVAGEVQPSAVGLIIKLQDDNRTSILPCNEWPDDYKQEGQRVRVSGVLKQICPVGSPNIKVDGGHPFVITKIESTTNE